MSSVPGRLSSRPRVPRGRIVRYTPKLFNRANSEFMVLGFLAFTVWACNKLGVMKIVDGARRPTRPRTVVRDAAQGARHLAALRARPP